MAGYTRLAKWTYHPTNQARDGKLRKMKVELVNLQGEPLRITDENGNPTKYNKRRGGRC